MPHRQRSARITDRYRDALSAIRDRAVSGVEAAFAGVTMDDLPGTYASFADTAVRRVASAQLDGARLTAAYLNAFATSETGKRERVTVPTRQYVGMARDGRLLADSLESPLIGIRAALKRMPVENAFAIGLKRATLNADLNSLFPARQTLDDVIETDPMFNGWARVTTGTCGACLSAAGDHGSLRFAVHPSCKCVQEPRVAGFTDLFPRPTGQQIFRDKTPEEQDEALGRAAAEAVRNGLPLESLAATVHVTGEPDWLVQGRVPQH